MMREVLDLRLCRLALQMEVVMESAVAAPVRTSDPTGTTLGKPNLLERWARKYILDARDLHCPYL